MINTTSQAKIPTALYIHTPWCIHKCPYCDFNSHKAPAILPETDFLNKLIQDFDADLNLAQNRKIESIFMGGGTPSLLSGSIIGGMLKAIRKRVVIKADAEITLEANPGASESSRFSEYIAQGVNRLSLGIQSFDDSKLARLGRIHNSREAKKAFLLARSAGFKRINIDLMHGLPQQSIEGALDDLKQAIELDPEHISWYQLTIEQNTEFYRSPPVLPEEGKSVV